MTSWEKFSDGKIREIAKEKSVLDIGGGYRSKKRGLIKYEDLFKNTDYKVLDIDPGCQPDIVGDIHNLPQKDGSVDAIVCRAVLEHVYDPQKAVNEMYRVLKKGGKCLAYLPFLYPYHGKAKAYKDYYRYTKDGVEHLFRNFNSIEICPVRGNLETMINLIPFKVIRIFMPIARLFDRFFSYKQVSGYSVFLVK